MSYTPVYDYTMINSSLPVQVAFFCNYTEKILSLTSNGMRINSFLYFIFARIRADYVKCI
jgi:hypothetical protein